MTTSPPTPLLSADMTMADLLAAFPGARRALFAKYHIGGCQSCAFSQTETVAELCARNESIPVEEMLDHLMASKEHDAQIQIFPRQLSNALASPTPPRLVDVRSREEHEAVTLPGALFWDQALIQEIFGRWNKEEPITVFCHQGTRSLDAAAYLIGHGFSNVTSLAGGIDAWSCEIDPTLPRYKLEIE